MSFIHRMLAIARSNPTFVVLAAAGLILAALPLTNASHLGTGGEDVRFDVSSWTPVYVDGAYMGDQSTQYLGSNLTRSTAYELMFIKIPHANATQVELRSPAGAVVSSASLSIGVDGPGGSLRNATFLVTTSTFATSGFYTLDYLGETEAPIGAVFAGERPSLTHRDLVVPATSSVGVPVTVSVMVENPGNESMAGTEILLVNNAQRDSYSILLAPGGSQQVSFTFTPTVAGTYSVAARLGNSTLPAQLLTVGAECESNCTPPPCDVNSSCPPPPQPCGTPDTPPCPTPCGSPDSPPCPPPPCGCPPCPPGEACQPCAPCPTPATFRIWDVRASALTTTTAPIRMGNVTDFGSATLTLTYDPSVVEVTNVTNGDVPNSTLTWNIDQPNGTVTMLLTRDVIGGPGPFDFDFARLTFRAVGPIGSTSPLNLTPIEVTDANGTDLPAYTQGAFFRSGILGDADGDGDVDANDAKAVAEAIVGRRTLASLAIPNADVSGDGRVTGRDSMLIAQFVAGTRYSF